MHFEKDYSTTAWIHSLIDSATMLCGKTGLVYQCHTHTQNFLNTKKEKLQ